ncbi:hypothetical protein CVT26_003387 [Gymnopilus dilepis]|uniref:Gamma tubulin complex component C-terminal domain-containing protein n=1 Tax=Gymnopilus dilepis TaxID=231916 RepID=A0A409VQT3_9AGAR|nr:hypothetical protein CVT26_003387 [Gymnopilus dilepis]
MLLVILSIYVFQSSIHAYPVLPSPSLDTSFRQASAPPDPSYCTCPNQRSTWDILWSCVATIFACSWVAVHPNVPAPEEAWQKTTLRRLELMFWSLVTPEMMIFWAMRQWFGARHLARVWKKKGWTTTHGYFLEMGGFMLYDKDRPLGVLFPEMLKELYEQGKIDFPIITAEEIRDRSKADALAKTIAVGQTTWFVAQCAARSFEGLEVTELELITVGLALLSGFMYFLWWNKPLDVKLGVPVYLLDTPREKAKDVEIEDVVLFPDRVPVLQQFRFMSFKTGQFVLRIPRRIKAGGITWAIHAAYALKFYPIHGIKLAVKRLADMAKWPLLPPTTPESQTRVGTFYAAPAANKVFNKIRYFAVTSSLATAFGAIQVVGWSRLAFPSHFEMQLWTVSSVIITIIPFSILFSTLLVIVSDNVDRKHQKPVSRLLRWLGAILGILTMLIFPVYVVARLVLLFEAFGGLRSLPPRALDAVAWTSIIPHIYPNATKMASSSNSNLSVKGHPPRPLSSLSSRPSSRNTIQRPASSIGTRPTSSASLRPGSRFSRPSSRQARSRLIPICQTLATQVTGLKEDGTNEDPDGERFRESVDYVLKHVENTVVNKGSASVDMGVVDKRISGLALKARINTQDVFAEALTSAYQRLKSHIEEREADLDQEIKTSHIPDHLQFLLALNKPPTDVTLMKAQTYLETIANPPPPPPSLTWADILAEDPFEGEHWEGVDLPGSKQGISRREGVEEWDSSPSLSPLSDDDDFDLDKGDVSFSSARYQESSDSSPPRSPSPPLPRTAGVRYPYEDRKVFEELRAKQYWRDDWHTDANVHPEFDIGDPSTLGPTLSRVLAQASGFRDAYAMLKPEHYIDEDDMTREILMALQGNRNIVLTWRDGSFKVAPNAPRLIHLSLASQESILSSLAQTASTLQNLRRFSAAVFSRSNSGKPGDRRAASSRTCEAFADAIDGAVREFDAWCASREESMCRASLGLDEEPLVVSLLSTERAIRDQYESTFEVLLEIVMRVFNIKPEESFAEFDQNIQLRQPSVLTAFLLDTLFSSVRQHMERGETVTSNALMRVFVRTAEPVWSMVGNWLKNGMGLGLGVGNGGKPGMTGELDDEFFIESSGIGVGMMGMGLLDPEFWKEGYALREGLSSSDETGPDDAGSVFMASGSRRRAIPLFLEHVADMVLSSGKAVGLMRALGNPLEENVPNRWKSFAELVSTEEQDVNDEKKKTAGLFSVSVDTLSRLIYDELLPQCQASGAQLSKVLVDDCALWKHLDAIEDLFLMRRGDAMSHFVDVVFAKMDSPQSWADFHFLNTAFNDVVEGNMNAGTKEWINPSLVRFSYRGGKDKDKTIKRTVKAVDGLGLEYAAPFPLTYIFQPKTIQVYNEVFVLLVQIRRAKRVLERILVRDDSERDKTLRQEFKAFYAMRSRLSWFTKYVHPPSLPEIYVLTQLFEHALSTLLNFLTTYVIHAEVLRFHEAFPKAGSLDEMIQLHDDHEGFMAFAGDSTATLDVSRQSISIKRHRSRRQRRQRRNIIGFSQSLQMDEDSSDDDDEDFEPEHLDRAAEPSLSISVTSTSIAGEEDFFTRMERMSSELDSLVRFIRRGVESLAGGTSDAASAFGVLAFSLEDWDI